MTTKTCNSSSSGPGCVWYSFLIANGGRDLSQYIKNVVWFERVRPRSRSEPSPPEDSSRRSAPRLVRSRSAPETPPVVPVQYTHLQLVPAPPAPVRALGNHRCRLGWKRGAVESRGDVAGPLVQPVYQRAPRPQVGSAGVAAEGSSLGQSQRGRRSHPRASRDGRASSSRRPTPPPLAQVVAEAGGVAPGD